MMCGSTDGCKSEAKTDYWIPAARASFILGTIETLIVHQNWNSAGANVGMAICNIALKSEKSKKFCLLLLKYS